MADVCTALRIGICIQIVILSLFSPGEYSYNTILQLLLLGWITDVLDGKLARFDKSTIPTWFGRNERKLDIILVGTAHLYLSRFVVLNPYLFYSIAILGIIAFVRMIFQGETELFLQMVYISLVCGFILIRAIIENQYFWIPTLIFLLSLMVINWMRFIDDAQYFLSLGARKNSN